MRKRIAGMLLLLIFLAPFSSLFLLPSVEGADGDEWLTGWTYRKSHVIGNASGAGTNYPVRVHVNYSNGVDSGELVYVDGNSSLDFGDIRFTSSDGETELDYWMERRGVYPINFTKLSNNPLKNLGQGYWFTSFYSNYSGEDKIYLIIQESTSPETNISMWSFHPSDADNSSSWTDHGVIISGAEAWENYHREPHSVIFETQAMADARVGGTGVRSWRLYYCGIDSGLDANGLNYRIGIATAPENDPTNWTRPTDLNPIYGPEEGKGVADPEAFIRNDTVWMAVTLYNGGGTAQKEYYTVSDDGITGWTDKDDVNLLSPSPVWGENFVHGNDSLISMLIGGSGGVNAFCTNDGRSTWAYDNNPVLSWGIGGSWDDAGMACPTTPKTKEGGITIDGTTYLFYMGKDGGDYQIGGAVSEDFDGDAYFWVEVSEDLGSNRTIYVYYGNSGETTTSNGTATFLQFDEFSDLDDWTIDKDSATETITSLVNDPLVVFHHRLHTYAHLERAQTNDNITIRIKGRVPDSADATWALSFSVYFNLYDYAELMFREDRTTFMATGVKDGVGMGIEAESAPGSLVYNAFYWVRIRVVVDTVYYDYSGDGISWTNICSTVRVGTWDTPDLTIMGHGHEVSAGSYPNADWDNSFATPGAEIDTHADQYVARKYLLSEPTHGVWGAPESEAGPGGNTAPTRGGYVLDQFDAPDLLSDGEPNTRFWFSAYDVDGYATIDTLEVAIGVGSTWCNFSYDTTAEGGGSWTKTTEQPYVELFNDGWGGSSDTYNMYAWIQANPGAPDTYGVEVYQRVIDTSAGSSGWGRIYGTPFNIVESGDDSGSGGAPSGGDPDEPPPEGPGDPDWWMDEDNLDDMSEDDLRALADALDVDVNDDDTKADIIAKILDKAEEDGFTAFEGCGLTDEEKLALLDHLLNLTVPELRLECQDLGISYKLWRDPEPYIILIFTVGYGCTPPDEFYERGYFDPEDWDGDGVSNWDDPDMFDETRIGLGARVEDIDISTSIPWIQQNGYLLIILALFLAFMYSQVKKSDKPGSRGESLLRPPGKGYLPGERK